MNTAHRVALLLILVLHGAMSGCALEAEFYMASQKEFATPAGVEDVYVTSGGGRVHCWYTRAPAGPVALGVVDSKVQLDGEGHIEEGSGGAEATSGAKSDNGAAAPTVRRGALLFCHGARFTLDDLLPVVRPLADQSGVSMMMPSYRGFGRSSPLENLSRRSTAADALAAYDALAARPDVDPSRIVVMGYSLGGPAALAVAMRRPVAGVIVGGTFSHASAVLEDRKIRGLGWLIGDLYDPADCVAKLGNRPLLLLHGSEDTTVLPYHLYAIAAAASRAGVPTTVKVIEGAAHRDVFVAPEFQRTIVPFIRRVVGEGAQGATEK